MASKTQICNQALIIIGESTITDIDNPTDEQGRVLSQIYNIVLEEVLARWDWNFAKARAELASTTDPAFGYDAAYAMPADCFRVVACYNNETPIEDWITEGRNILSNSIDPDSDELQIVYIQKMTDPAVYPPHFTKLLAYELAVRMTVKRSADKRFAEALQFQREQVEREAWAVDARTAYVEEYNNNVQDAGRS